MKIFPRVKLSSFVIAFAMFLFAVILTNQLNAATIPNIAPKTTSNQDLIIAQREVVSCNVADPTGTPLNLRSFPNSGGWSVVNSTLANNGEGVAVYGLSLDYKWVFVGSRDGGYGWAWRAYLDCPGL